VPHLSGLENAMQKPESQRVKRRLQIAAVVFVTAGLTLFWAVARSPAFKQKTDEVVILEPGKRSLGSPQPVATEARLDQEFAWLSQAAYERVPDGEHNDSIGCPNPDSALQDLGWYRWKDFPDPELQQEIAKSHLRVDVWTNSPRKLMAIAFGGTVFANREDWKSNLRWFIPIRNDEYTLIVKKLGPALIREFRLRIQQPKWAFLQDSTILATGHSLGGGLAQQFAYSLPGDWGMPRVTKVFAFDPSPVTGYYSSDSKTRSDNARHLEIDRIYERGEILAPLRSIENLVYPPSATEPMVRHVRFNLFDARNPLAGHSIAELACALHKATL
jgi:hypothetical protein